MNYQHWDHERQKHYSRYGKRARESFKALDRLFNQISNNGKIDKERIERNEIIGGIPYNIVYDNSKQKDLIQIQKIAQTVNNAVKTIKNTPFQDILKYLKVSINLFDKSGSIGSTNLASGLFDASTGMISLFGLAQPKTIIHEIGHLVHYKLSETAWKEWVSFIAKGKFDFSKEEIQQLRQAFDKAWADGKESENNRPRRLEYTYTNIPKYLFGIILEKYNIIRRFEFTLTKLSDISVSNDNEYIKKVWEINISDLSRSFYAGAVSDYANTNPMEAFAEVFSYYIIRKPIKPLVLDAFLRVTGKK